MDKFANKLLKNKLGDIVSKNITMLKQTSLGKKEKKYRLLYDELKDELYVRAIISKDKYNDYDNNIAIVIALISLYRDMKNKAIEYKLDRIEYNESTLRMFFVEKNKRVLSNIGFVKNVIMVSNDEVKKESFKFDAIATIEFIDPQEGYKDIIIQPFSSPSSKIKSNILSISHGLGVKKFMERLDEIDKSVDIHDQLFELITQISKITDIEQILFLIKRLVDKARDSHFKEFKGKVENVINSTQVSNIIQLLSLFNKMEHVTSTDIEATEYIRYIIYKALIERK